MIECLSNECWINPQIDFLLFLQNIRIGHFEMFDQFFLSVTIFGEMWLPTLICAAIYWCIDFKSGLYLFSLSSVNMLLSQFFKMIACVYRPWVLSDKIHPVEQAVVLAKGYSFPSGHSAQASAVFGGLALLLWKKKPIAILLILLALLVGFSRMWLGVHTPQDVIVGLMIGFPLVFILNWAINWAEKNINRYLYLLAGIDIAAIFVILYVCYLNSYPIDYVDGKLLVNPHSSIQTIIVSYGYVLGIINGAFICRRFFPFNPKEGSLTSKLVRAIVGFVLTTLLFNNVLRILFCNPCDFKIGLAIPFLIGFFVTGIYPYLFSKYGQILKK